MYFKIPKEFVKYADEVTDKYDCRVLNITLRPEKKTYVLRVTIDGNDTSLNTCADISRELSLWLDSHESDIKCPSYHFEVSSPGLYKKLVTEQDFINCIDKTVYFETKTKAINGRKKYRGKVLSCEHGIVHIYTREESAEFDIVISDIAKARIEYEI